MSGPISLETESERDDDNEEAHEAEDGDGGEEEAAAAEPTPEPAATVNAPRSEKDVDRALKALERAGTTYRNAVSRAMGEDAQELEQCPRCNAPVAGMIFPPATAPVDDDTRDAVLASIGQGATASPPLQPAKGVETCPSCLGNGVLEFPTFVAHTREQQCVKCQGAGYVNVDTPQPAITGTSWPAPQGNGELSNTLTFPPADRWGRPTGHPHYGIPPASVGA